MAQTETTLRILLLEGNDRQREALAVSTGQPGVELLCPPPNASLLQQIGEASPPYLFLDGDLLDCAGYQVLTALRDQPGLQDVRVVMMVDGLPAARARAFDAGADEVLVKPYTRAEVLDTVAKVERFQFTFWGTRGTLPLTGEAALRYGGNTSCLGLDVGCDRHFVFDAGTGLRRYSRHLLERQGGKFDGRVFITHPHWDHLNCLPFFSPFYIPGNHISLMGPPQGDRSFRKLLDGQMDGTYFPITVEAFGADVTYGDMLEGEYRFDGVTLKAFHLSHPGYCLGYRIERFGRSVAYITDNELGNIQAGDDYIERLVGFLHGVDMLIHDTAYFDHEYPGKINWGHSSISQVVRLAHAAKVGKLFLFHHDPEHGDRELELKLAEATRLADELSSTVECLLACEGDVWDLRTLERVPAV